MRRLLTYICLFLTTALTAVAQDDVEYRAEIGAAVVGNTYLGDFNGSLTKNICPGGGVVFRRIFNPYMAMRVQAMYTQLKGDYADASTVYPELEDVGYDFKNTAFDLSATYEYNFLPYGTGRDVRGTKRLTPFISLGVGMTYVRCKNGTRDYSNDEIITDAKSIVTANIPLGVGVKYKLGARTNISLDWQMHFSLSDKLDGVKDPYYIKSSGVFKNTDCYSTLSLAVTYSISAKCPTCQKQR